MAARRPFWKWHRWKSIGFCLWPPSTCIWNLKLKFQSKLDLCSGNHVVYRQTDGQTDRRTRWIQYTPPPTSLGGGIISHVTLVASTWTTILLPNIQVSCSSIMSKCWCLLNWRLLWTTQWGLSKITTTLQRAFSHGFCWMKIVFWFIFH